MKDTIKAEDLGYQLPIGKTTGRSFKFKPWRAKDERQVGEIRARNRKMSVGEFTTEVLSHFLVEWCGEDWTEKASKEKKLAINQSFAADVHHAWVMLRREALGDILPMSVTCSSCGENFQFRAELGSIDVATVEDGGIIETPHVLRDGIEYRGDTRHTVTLAPLRWNVFEKIKGGGLNIGKIKLQVIAGSIVGLGGVEGQIQLAPGMLDDMTKFDIETLSSKLDDFQPGPDFRLDVDCPSCGAANRESISWLYDSFFSMGASSISEAPGR